MGIFNPQYMEVGILTAALQELTPREIRDKDPDRAIEDWIVYANDIGVKNIQLSSAIHPSLSDVPAEAMLDPVANHLDLRKPFNSLRARRVKRALGNMRISDIGYFDNMLHPDRKVREMKHKHMKRVMDAANLLQVKAVCGFVGRNPGPDMDQNFDLFERQFVPLLKAAKERGLVYRVEQCPMPGWNTTDVWENNIAYVPGTWIRLHQIAEKHKVGDQFRIHYDPSHAILMGQNTRDIFQFLKDKEYNFLIAGFHVKGQVIDPRGIAEWGYRGQTVDRGDRINGKPNPEAKKQGNAWLKQVALCTHELPGTARHDPLAYLQNRTVDWFDHQYAARELLGLDIANTDLVVEHEYGPARTQDSQKLLPMLQGSVNYIRSIDQAAGNQYALHKVMETLEIPVQGIGRRAYRD